MMRPRKLLVVGASSGIGLAVAQAASRADWSVTLASRNGARCAELASTIQRTASAPISSTSLDVTSEISIRAAFKAATEYMDGVDCVVNTAGVTLRRPLTETSLAEWRDVMAVNLDGAFLVCREALASLPASGSIVNVSSTAALKSLTNRGAYAASKAGVIALTRQVASEGAARGVRCNAVAPGGTHTPLLEDAARKAGLDVEEMLKRSGRAHPIGRLATPEEIAASVLFLASEESSFTTGSVLVVDGGVLM